LLLTIIKVSAVYKQQKAGGYLHDVHKKESMESDSFPLYEEKYVNH
jgi:hypothetical protein